MSVPAMHGLVEFGGGGGGTLQVPPVLVGLSSMTLSQSSSTPLHSSGVGSLLPTQVSDPFKHCSVPRLHGNTLLMPHEPPASVGKSSTMPSQSSSAPLHSSGKRFSVMTFGP